MDDRDFLGYYLFAVMVVVLSLQLFLFKSQEWQCERDFNVYDCEQEWYPVFHEMSPEDEELLP